jgi:hypothetical protein
MKKPRYTEQQIAQARAAAGGDTLHGRGVSWECLAVEVNTSLTSARVVAVLGRVVVGLEVFRSNLPLMFPMGPSPREWAEKRCPVTRGRTPRAPGG